VKIKIQVVIELDSGNTQIIQEVSKIERSSLQPENLGLSIAESKTLLQNIQSTLVERQVAEYLAQNSSCLHCEKKLLHKDKRTIVYRTVFGKLNLSSQRLFHCACQAQPTRYFNPIATLLIQRTSPERLYLESKFAALMSYGLSVKLLQEVLPIEGEINTSSIRNNLHSCGQRLEAELGEEKGGYIEGCQREWEKLPIPDLPLVVGMDGGYLRSTKPKLRDKGNFEAIVGKSVKADGTSKRFGGVHGYDAKPQRRIFEVLKSQGMQMNQQVTFMSDGDDKLRQLQFGLTPNAEYLLDWFHITMRLTVMSQTAKGLTKEDAELELTKKLDRIKWYLWHGNIFKASQLIENLVDDLEVEIFDGNDRAEIKKLFKLVREFETYISNNSGYIPNYGERWRNGEAIATGFVESTVNQVITKRFVKKQQMRWTPKGAHLLLQVRLSVLNEDFRSKFQQWYPGLRAGDCLTETCAIAA
jgi:hypothetical protein